MNKKDLLTSEIPESLNDLIQADYIYSFHKALKNSERLSYELILEMDAILDHKSEDRREHFSKLVIELDTAKTKSKTTKKEAVYI